MNRRPVAGQFVQPPGSTATACVCVFICLCLCETGYLYVCVHVFKYPLISGQWEVMSQQWLGGTAELSEPLSTALSLLGNRLAPRLHTSHLHWPQTQGQEWGTGEGTCYFRACYPQKCKPGLLACIWTPDFVIFSLWPSSGLRAMSPHTPFLSRMLFIGGCIYTELLETIQGWSLM